MYGEVIYDPRKADTLKGKYIIGSNNYIQISDFPETCKEPVILKDVKPNEMFPFRGITAEGLTIKGFFIREVLND